MLADQHLEAGQPRGEVRSQTRQIAPGRVFQQALRDEPACYKEEIDEPAARRLLRAVLHRDLAYHMERMPLARAENLADRFLAQFGPGTRYFTNGTWHLPDASGPDGVVCGASWDPVTEATFDTGVLAIGPGGSGCLWVEDED